MAATAGQLHIRALCLIDGGQVRVRHADDEGRVLALVNGGSGNYVVRRSPGGGWSCSCLAASYGNRCSHMAAVALVTAGPEG